MKKGILIGIILGISIGLMMGYSLSSLMDNVGTLKTIATLREELATKDALIANLTAENERLKAEVQNLTKTLEGTIVTITADEIFGRIYDYLERGKPYPSDLLNRRLKIVGKVKQVFRDGGTWELWLWPLSHREWGGWIKDLEIAVKCGKTSYEISGYVSKWDIVAVIGKITFLGHSDPTVTEVEEVILILR